MDPPRGRRSSGRQGRCAPAASASCADVAPLSRNEMVRHMSLSRSSRHSQEISPVGSFVRQSSHMQFGQLFLPLQEDPDDPPNPSSILRYV